MRVLGIDPGSQVTGYGVLEGEKALSWGIIRPKKGPLAQRLLDIYQGLTEVISRFSPQVVALEEVIPESYPRSALKLGQAQGIAILAAAQRGLPVYFYHPLEIKKALTGYGNATKEQLNYIVRGLLSLPEDIPLDASDALSVAFYHLQVFRFQAKVE